MAGSGTIYVRRTPAPIALSVEEFIMLSPQLSSIHSISLTLESPQNVTFPVNNCHLYGNPQLRTMQYNGRNVRLELYTGSNGVFCQAPIVESLVFNSDLDNYIVETYVHYDQHYIRINEHNIARNNNNNYSFPGQQQSIPESQPIRQNRVLKILTVVHNDINNICVTLDRYQVQPDEEPVIEIEFSYAREDHTQVDDEETTATTEVRTSQEIQELQRNAHAAREAFLNFKRSMEGVSQSSDFES